MTMKIQASLVILKEAMKLNKTRFGAGFQTGERKGHKGQY